MDKRFLVIIGLLVVGFAGFIWLGSGKKEASTTAVGAKPTQHINGNPNAPVKLVEYSDFQCPYCALYYPIVEQIVQKYHDRISFQYRHYPLSTVHRNAFAAARAAEAAGKQGKFWEMYNALFSNQSKWADSSMARSTFEGYALGLGLDIATFKTDFASPETNAAINADVAAFNRLGLNPSTPTFLLNGKKIEPRDTVDDFSKLIDEQLQQAAGQ